MIHSVLIQSHDEQCAPPDEVLQVGVVDDVIFLEIGKYEETYDTSEIRSEAQIGVKVEDLLFAIQALSTTVEVAHPPGRLPR